jgi:hypothetical protein
MAQFSYISNRLAGHPPASMAQFNVTNFNNQFLAAELTGNTIRQAKSRIHYFKYLLS